MRNLNSAAVDLGLGDGNALQQQVQDDEEERKKKLLAMTRADTGLGLLSPAISSLGLGGARG